MHHLQKAFAQSGTVGEIAAGNDHVIRHLPVELLGNLEGGGLLPFQPVGIDGVEQIDRGTADHFRQHPHAAVEVSIQLAGDGAVIDGLGELGPGDLALGQQDQAVHAGAGGVGRHGGRGVAGGGAGHPLEAALARLRKRSRHARVFERAGGVHALVFGVELLHAQLFRALQEPVERRVAFAQRDGLFGMEQNRQQLAKAPHPALIDGESGLEPLLP